MPVADDEVAPHDVGAEDERAHVAQHAQQGTPKNCGCMFVVASRLDPMNNPAEMSAIATVPLTE